MSCLYFIFGVVTRLSELGRGLQKPMTKCAAALPRIVNAQPNRPYHIQYRASESCYLHQSQTCRLRLLGLTHTSFKRSESLLSLLYSYESFMSMYNTQRQFVISTPAERGAWCKERRSTISLINSHIASFRHKSAAQLGPQDIAALVSPQYDHDNNASGESTDHQTDSAKDPSIGFHFGADPRHPLESGPIDAVNNVQRMSRDQLMRIKPRRYILSARNTQSLNLTGKPESGQQDHDYQGSRRTAIRLSTEFDCPGHLNVSSVPLNVSGSLIPFVALPIKVSVKGQHLLQYCESNTGSHLQLLDYSCLASPHARPPALFWNHSISFLLPNHTNCTERRHPDTSYIHRNPYRHSRTHALQASKHLIV